MIFDRHTPVIVTGGETGCGEVLRGDVLHIDYDEAIEDQTYAFEALEDAHEAEAHENVISSLVDILMESHGATERDIEKILSKENPSPIDPIPKLIIETLNARGQLDAEEAESLYREIEEFYPDALYSAHIGPMIDAIETALLSRREGSEAETS